MKTLIRIISILGITKKNRKAIRAFLNTHIYMHIYMYLKLSTACHIKNKKDILSKIKYDNLHLSHPIGLVIWNTTKIGKNVKILQNTTIASEVLEIQDNVQICANCCLTKPITIGKCSIIGANSFVNKDVPPYELWGGVPAKFIRKVTKEEVEAYKKAVNAID